MNPIVKYLALAIMAKMKNDTLKENMHLELAMMWAEDLSTDEIMVYNNQAHKMVSDLVNLRHAST
jgi:hypothetical protein